MTESPASYSLDDMVNKRLQKAKDFHREWLEDRGLTRKQIRAKRDPKRPAVAFPDLKVDENLPLSNGFAKAGFHNTPMSNRHKETPEVRAEIEKKAMSIGPHFNKGGYQYMTPGDKPKYQPKVRK